MTATFLHRKTGSNSAQQLLVYSIWNLDDNIDRGTKVLGDDAR